MLDIIERMLVRSNNHVLPSSELQHKPVLVDLTVEEGTRLKVLYGSSSGFHAVDLDSASVYDIYLPKHAQVGI